MKKEKLSSDALAKLFQGSNLTGSKHPLCISGTFRLRHAFAPAVFKYTEKILLGMIELTALG